MKMRIKLSAVLMAIVILLATTMPSFAAPEEIDLTPLYVGGVQMGKDTYLAEGASDITTTQPSGGYAYLAADGLTLTLHNYNYIGAGYVYHPDYGYSAAIKWMGATVDIVIVLEGNNTITTTGTGINIDGQYAGDDAKLAIRGSGSDSLTVNAPDNDGITADGGLTVSNCAVTVNSGSTGLRGGTSSTKTGGVIIINSKVKVYDRDTAIQGYDAFYITNSIVEAYGNNNSFYNSEISAVIVPTYTDGYIMKAGTDAASAAVVTAFSGERWFRIEPTDGYIPELPPETPETPEIPETPHAHNVVTVPATPATCTDDGLTQGSICADCGDTIIEQQVVAALGHFAGEWVIDYPATATSDGQRSRYCTRCGISLETEAIAHHSHTEGYRTQTVAPTCTQDGEGLIICADCGAAYDTYVISALDHDAGVWKVDFEPTADHDGQRSRYCTRCDECLESEVIVRHTHTEGYRVEKIAPTCTRTGLGEIFCKDCGIVYDTYVIEALGHDGGVWKIDYEPTADHDGQKSRYCTRCGECLESVAIVRHTHTEGYRAIVIEPTCTTAGEGGIFCADCGAMYGTYAIEALGHDYSAWYKNNDGTHSKSCSRCHDVQTANCTYTTVATEPTCTEGGYTTYTCTECGHTYVDNYVDALGHDFTEWTSVDDIHHTRSCQRTGCGLVETEEHTFGEWTYNKDAKFFKNGTKSCVCDDCGHKLTDVAKHTAWIMHVFYPIIIWVGNVVHKALKVVSLDWFIPWMTIRPTI